ncbi:MAG TPA: NAD+ synthase [bacterium (Candidatus Stahlbacteria)]|nr:NAD+ synthase [Candidatus Stahlbacteria bacterium]
MRITLAQLNPIIGDIEGNLAQIGKSLSVYDSDLIVFPELFLTGYPPRDLLERPEFIERICIAIEEVKEVSRHNPDIGLLFGAPILRHERLYNAAILVFNGDVIGTQPKSLLPNYDVFDEKRYFSPAPEVRPIEFKGEKLGVTVCEDAWNDPELNIRASDFDPVADLARKGATILINISASPFTIGKEEIRFRIVKGHAKRHKLPFIYVNQVGANDELIFDGRSMVLDREGRPIAILPPFKEDVVTIDFDKVDTIQYEPQDRIESVRDGLILGIQDYMRKCGFDYAVLGISGGIDSAVTAYLACQAVGGNNVLGVAMPSPYTSEKSVGLARRITENLGMKLEMIPITAIYESYRRSLNEVLKISKEVDITLENIQARIRGNILMALSNRHGYLVLSTGNKSELAVGYCTLYGDMTGGLAVLSDVPKTMVYELARFINRKEEIIPEAIIKRTPSAELKPDQTDQDTLPPYEILDQILSLYIDEHRSRAEIINEGFDPETVDWVLNAVNRNEYKRRQAAPGLKVTTKAFGIGWRMPIAARYK